MGKNALNSEKFVSSIPKIANKENKKGLPIDNTTLRQLVENIAELKEKLDKKAYHIKVFKND